MIIEAFGVFMAWESWPQEEEEVETNDRLRREVLGLTNNMEDIFTTNQQKAFKYAKMKLERMDLLDNQEILALGEQEISEIFAGKGKNNSLWSNIKWESEGEVEYF